VEQYRTLRTNLTYLGVSTDKKVILVTSFMRDEGKSFTSLNLSGILAQTGKKVVVLEFDLRKPKLSSQLKIENNIGISNYITGAASISQIIKPVALVPNLYIISSGPISPNPAELLLNEKVITLFDELRATFDYIIIDSAPVGLVSDTFSITKFADVTLYIVRHKLSLKPTLTFLQTLFEEKKLPYVGIVINGIKTRRFEYGYGYGAYYSSYSGEEVYGNEQPVKANFLKNLFSKKR
jgi:capsular exopolysaccharide synthesis family protein